VRDAISRGASPAEIAEAFHLSLAVVDGLLQEGDGE
jgi:hypothetical protein